MTAPVAWIVPGLARLTLAIRYHTSADGTRWVYADGGRWYALDDITINTEGEHP